jgi:hypothetical protein
MKHPEPKWILSPVWGLAIDPLNWKLMRRGTNPKTGKPSQWRVVGYYPKLNMLVDSLAEKIMLTEPNPTDLLDQLKQAQEAGQALGSTLNAALHTMDRVGPKTLPPGYRAYQGYKTSSNVCRSGTG